MAVRAGFLLCRRRKAVAAPSLSAKRFLSCVSSPTVSSKEEKMALDMIRYAKSLKQDEPSYSEAVRVLEQGLSFFTGGELPSSMASGRLQLCLATIHANRYNYEAAAESLQHLINTGSMPLEIKGSAMEALACLCLQLHQDNEALVQADQLMSLLADEDVHAVQLQSMKFNSLALKKLVELALGSSDIELEGLSSLVDLENASGGAVLDIAELSHVHGSLSAAKVMYEKAISLSKKELEENGKFLSAIATTPEAVHTGAIAGLGQLLTSMGDFEGAEFQLTEALKLSEKTKGEKHPQVGAILSCIGNLYHQRAKAEGRSELLITEGVYKSALDLLKAQALDREIDRGEQYTDIVALTRARLGVALAPSLKRRSEVEKLKSSVETRWGNSRPLPDFLYLKHLLDSDNIDNKQETTAQGNTLVDIRLGRVFYK